MQKISDKAAQVFQKLIDTGKQKIDNCESAFMPVCIESIWDYGENKVVYSLAHYYKQEGDLLADPEMTFLKSPAGIFPLTFRQDAIGLYQTAAEIRHSNGELDVLFRKKLQASITAFANTWL